MKIQLDYKIDCIDRRKEIVDEICSEYADELSNYNLEQLANYLIYQMEKIPSDCWDEYIEWSEDFEYEKIGVPRPDAVIFLDMPVEVSQRLMTQRYCGDENKKDVHEANVEFLKGCRRSALYAAKKQGWYVVECSDGENPLEIEKIHSNIVSIVEKELSNA